MYCHPELHITAAARLQLAAAGFSTRFVNGILSGCVPVVFFPFVAMPWDSVLDFDTFALRVNESVFMNGLDAYLASISPQRIWELQDGVECVWRYFSWSSIWGQLDDEGGTDDAYWLMLEVLRRRLPGQRPAPLGCGGANATTVAWCGKLLEAQVVCVGLEI